MANVDQLLSRMDITIAGVDLIKGSIPMTMMLLDVLARAGSWVDSSNRITIGIREPNPDGSIEWGMQIEYRNAVNIETSGMYICCLRRTPSAETEFHS